MQKFGRIIPQKSACSGVANDLFSGVPATANHNDVDTAVTNELVLYCVVTDHECILCAATPAPLAFQAVGPLMHQ